MRTLLKNSKAQLGFVSSSVSVEKPKKNKLFKLIAIQAKKLGPIYFACCLFISNVFPLTSTTYRYSICVNFNAGWLKQTYFLRPFLMNI
jgi:hypothetical protein